MHKLFSSSWKRTGRLAALALAGTALLAGCKDYLDVDSLALNNTEVTFGTVTGARAALLGTYNQLEGDAAYGQRVSLYYPYDTDEMIGQYGTVMNDRRNISRYNALATLADISGPWTRLYRGVERANICIEGLRASPIYDTGAAADTAQMHRFYGEALALRALFMQELVRNWGDVPAQFQATQGGQDTNLPNADRNATLTRLVADLAVAEKLLPWRSAAGVTNSRFTKGAVKALRARIALQRGGYTLAYNSRTPTRQPDYLDYYRIARQECYDIMTHRSEHALTASYQEVWRSVNELRDMNNTELLLVVGMGGATAETDTKLGYYNGPLLASTTYGNSSGAVRITPPYFYAFDSLDTRRDVTITTYTITGAATYAGVRLDRSTDGKFRKDWRVPVANNPVGLQYLGFSWPLIRLSDVMLMFAEAQNELDGPATPYNGTNTAAQALLDVRARAFGGNSARAAAGLNLAGKDNFFTALVSERYLEFGGEGIRKYDLLRWNMLGTKLAEVKTRIKNMLELGTVPYGPTQVLVPVPATVYFRAGTTGLTYPRSFYRPAPATAPTGTTGINWGSSIDATYVANTLPTGTTYQSATSAGMGVGAEYVAGAGKELLPIPQSTLDVDPVLRQNAGY